ncbi:MAG: ABC transporter ATP-binding protein [Candidatus Omnitrophota bacterium]
MIQINDLVTYYFRQGRSNAAVNRVRLRIPQGCIFAVVGESGCGKTTLGLSITRLINPKDGEIAEGAVVFEDKNILKFSEERLRKAIRGKKISYVFQEPASSLNPVFTIGEQIAEALLVHKAANKKNVKAKVLEALEEARISDPNRVIGLYPHELSGGMKQRAMIAMAVSMRPKLLIADEPTTALDVATEDEILQLLVTLKNELSLSVLLITHDMRIVKKVADKIAVMYKGKIVEVGDMAKVLNNPKHEYTKLLIDSMPENLKL